MSRTPPHPRPFPFPHEEDLPLSGQSDFQGGGECLPRRITRPSFEVDARMRTFDNRLRIQDVSPLDSRGTLTYYSTQPYRHFSIFVQKSPT